MAHGDVREGKWRGKWRMGWVVSTLHTTSEHGVSSITTADAHTSAASSRMNGRPCRFKWTRPFRRKTKSGFCACAITFQTQCAIFFNITYQTARFKIILILKCVYWFSLQLLSETFLILRRIQRDIIINVLGFTLSTIYSCLVLIILELYRQIFEKYSKTNFRENYSSGNRVVPSGQTDIKPTGDFLCFRKASKNRQ
jgi:hypothetical protein